MYFDRGPKIFELASQKTHKHANYEKSTKSGAVKIGTELRLVTSEETLRVFLLITK